MFSAIILACNIEATRCQTFGTPRVMHSEIECYTSLANGLIQVENQGWVIKNFHCYEWKERESA